MEVTKKVDKVSADVTEGRRFKEYTVRQQKDVVLCSYYLGMLIRIVEGKHILIFVKSYLSTKHRSTVH